MTKNVKYLDLDEIAPVGKVIRLKGNEYEMKLFSVDDYIKMMQEASKVEKESSAENMPVDQQVSMLKDLIVQSFPTLPMSELGSMSLNQLLAILDFIKESSSEGADDLAKETLKKAEEQLQKTEAEAEKN